MLSENAKKIAKGRYRENMEAIGRYFTIHRNADVTQAPQTLTLGLSTKTQYLSMVIFILYPLFLRHVYCLKGPMLYMH